MELHFKERGGVHTEDFHVLVVADTHREAEKLARGFAPLIAHRGDVRVFHVGLGGAVYGLRVDLMIIGVTGHACMQNPKDAERWLRNDLYFRVRPHTAVIDINEITQGMWPR